MIYTADKRYPDLANLTTPEGVNLQKNISGNIRLERVSSYTLPFKNNYFGVGLIFTLNSVSTTLPLYKGINGSNTFEISLEKDVLVPNYYYCIVKLNTFTISAGSYFKSTEINSIFISIDKLLPIIYINGIKQEYFINGTIPTNFIMGFNTDICKGGSAYFDINVYNITEIIKYKMKEFDIEKWYRNITNGGVLLDTCYLSNYICYESNPSYPSQYILPDFAYVV